MTKAHISIFDPVGIKAGMDHYDSSLLEALMDEGAEVSLFSNFQWKHDIKQHSEFFEKELKKSVVAYLKFFSAYKRALKNSVSAGGSHALFHIFHFNKREEWMLKLSVKTGHQNLVVVHDVESFVNKLKVSRMKRMLDRYAHHIIVHNNFTKTELLRVLPELHEERVHVILHGHFHQLTTGKPDREEARKLLGWDPDEKVALFFGMIKPGKGLMLLLEAWNEVMPGATLVIAGRMRKHSLAQYAPAINQIKRKGKVDIRIRYIPNEERDLLFRACDLVILPYERIYQSGVQLMAMSYGKPILMSALPPVKEIIHNEENGFLFEPGNVDELAKKINILLSDPERCRIVGEHAKQTMLNGFGWEHVARQILTLIR